MRGHALGLLLLALPGVARGADLYDNIELVGIELSSGDVARRRDAVDKLDAFGPAAWPYLERALGDNDLEVRVRAAQSIGRHQFTQGVPLLIERLGDVEPRLRAQAAEALGLAADAEAAPRVARALERALGDSEHEVRSQAVQAIGRLPAPVGRLVVVSIAARLDDEHVGVRQDACEVLGRLGDPRAVIPLIGRLSDHSREVRRAAIEALGQLGDERAAPAIVRLLRDQPDEVRGPAISALGRLRSRAAVPPLTELLLQPERGSDGLRGRAAYALGLIASRPPERGAQATDATAQAAIGQAAIGQAATGQATPQATVDPALEALYAALERDDTRTAAREALERVGAPAVPALLERLAGASGEQLAVLVELLRDAGDGRALAPLVRELGRGRLPRERLVEAIAHAARAATVPADQRRGVTELAALLQDPDPVVRRRAAAGLSGLADARASATLAAAVEDTDREVRLAAIGELGRLHAVTALPALTRALAAAAARGPGDDETACAATRALGELGDARAASALVTQLERGSPRARQAAADALSRLREASAALPTLSRLAKSGPTEVRPDALFALGALLRGHAEEPRDGRPPRRRLDAGAAPGDARLAEARELCLGLAEGDDAHLAAAAVDALAAMHDPAALPRLERRLQHASSAGLRRRLVAAVGELRPAGDGQAASLLLGRLEDDPDPRVRAEAAWALGKHPESPAPGAAAALERALLAGEPAATPLRANAAAALARLGRAPQSLLRLLEDKSPAVRANAALALGRAPAPPAKAALERLRADDDRRVRAAALKAAAGRGPEVGPGRAGDWVAAHLVDYDGTPLAHAPYLLALPDGLVKAGVADARGTVREESVPSGTCDLELEDAPAPVR